MMDDTTDKILELKKERLLKKYWHSIVFCLILLIGTIILKVQDGLVDKAITNLFYDAGLPLGERFFLEDVQPWLFLNESNDIFEYFLYITLIPMMLIGLIFYKKKKYLFRYGSYGFVSALVGVVIFVNVIFKDLYGRPRPRQTSLWPNSVNADMFDFYSVWEPAFLKDPSLIDVGKSFPSGHVSLLAIFIIWYFIFMNPKLWANLVTIGKEKTKIRIFSAFKWSGLIISIVLGFLTGIGRIVVGAHHASDVLWAFGMVYIVNVILYHWIFRMPKYEQKMMNQLNLDS
ncbi:MAG: phosphatase PAP2 family protein [Promethearchaeota archaeon]